MQRNQLVILMVSLSTLALTGCSGAGSSVKSMLGLESSGLDEYRVMSRPPLAIPPEFDLKPPAPGQSQPVVAMPDNNAGQNILLGKDPNAAITSSDIPAKSRAEETLLNSAGAAHANPEIRTVITKDSEVTVQEKKKKEKSWYSGWFGDDDDDAPVAEAASAPADPAPAAATPAPEAPAAPAPAAEAKPIDTTPTPVAEKPKPIDTTPTGGKKQGVFSRWFGSDEDSSQPSATPTTATETAPSAAKPAETVNPGPPTVTPSNATAPAAPPAATLPANLPDAPAAKP